METDAEAEAVAALIQNFQHGSDPLAALAEQLGTQEQPSSQYEEYADAEILQTEPSLAPPKTPSIILEAYHALVFEQRIHPLDEHVHLLENTPEILCREFQSAEIPSALSGAAVITTSSDAVAQHPLPTVEQLEALLDTVSTPGPTGKVLILDHLDISACSLSVPLLSKFIHQATALGPWWRLRSLRLSHCNLSIDHLRQLTSLDSHSFLWHLQLLDMSGNPALGARRMLESTRTVLRSVTDFSAPDLLFLMPLWDSAPLRYVNIAQTGLSCAVLVLCLRMLRKYSITSGGGNGGNGETHLHQGTRPVLQCLKLGPPGDDEEEDSIGGGGSNRWSDELLAELTALMAATPLLTVLELHGAGAREREVLSAGWQAVHQQRGTAAVQMAEVRPGVVRFAAGVATQQCLDVERIPSAHTLPREEVEAVDPVVEVAQQQDNTNRHVLDDWNNATTTWEEDGEQQVAGGGGNGRGRHQGQQQKQQHHRRREEGGQRGRMLPPRRPATTTTTTASRRNGGGGGGERREKRVKSGAGAGTAGSSKSRARAGSSGMAGGREHQGEEDAMMMMMWDDENDGGGYYDDDDGDGDGVNHRKRQGGDLGRNGANGSEGPKRQRKIGSGSGGAAVRIYRGGNAEDDLPAGGIEIGSENSAGDEDDEDDDDDEEEEEVDGTAAAAHTAPTVDMSTVKEPFKLRDGKIDEDSKQGRIYRKEAKSFADAITNRAERRVAKAAFHNWDEHAEYAWDRQRWQCPAHDQVDEPHILGQLNLLFDIAHKYGVTLHFPFPKWIPGGGARAFEQAQEQPPQIISRLMHGGAAAVSRPSPPPPQKQEKGTHQPKKKYVSMVGRTRMVDDGGGGGRDDEDEGDVDEGDDGFMVDDHYSSSSSSSGDDDAIDKETEVIVIDDGEKSGGGGGGDDDTIMDIDLVGDHHNNDPGDISPSHHHRRDLIQSDSDAEPDGQQLLQEALPQPRDRKGGAAAGVSRESKRLQPWGWDSRIEENPANEDLYGLIEGRRRRRQRFSATQLLVGSEEQEEPGVDVGVGAGAARVHNGVWNEIQAKKVMKKKKISSSSVPPPLPEHSLDNNSSYSSSDDDDDVPLAAQFPRFRTPSSCATPPTHQHTDDAPTTTATIVPQRRSGTPPPTLEITPLIVAGAAAGDEFTSAPLAATATATTTITAVTVDQQPPSTERQETTTTTMMSSAERAVAAARMLLGSLYTRVSPPLPPSDEHPSLLPVAAPVTTAVGVVPDSQENDD